MKPWLKWTLYGLALGAFLWAWNQCAESRIQDARDTADSIAVEESLALARADSLVDSTNALEDSLSVIDSIARRDSLRLARIQARNAHLADSLSALSVRLAAEATAAGQRFDSVWARASDLTDLPELDTLRAIHETQTQALAGQVQAERARADSNRVVIREQSTRIATLQDQVSIRETVIQNLHEENDNLRDALSSAQDRADHWESEANPGFFVSIGKDLEKYAATLAIGAGVGAVLAQ